MIAKNAARPILSFALFAVVIAIACLVLLQSTQASEQQTVMQDDENATEEVPLHDHMEAIGDSLRDAFRAVGDAATRDEALQSIANIQKHLVAAKSIPAPGLEAQPEADRVAYASDYRKALSEVLIEFTKLEIDVLEGRHEEAVDRIRNSLVPMRNAAHEKYQVED